MSQFEDLKKAIKALKQGKMVILVDDQDRENEGDLVIAAEHVSPDSINFMAKNARGLICLAITKEICQKLNLPPMVTNDDNNSKFGTAFTVSIDAAKGISSGISAADRAKTILDTISSTAKPDDLARPGHIFPLAYREGGVLVRTGHTEGAVDLCKTAGLKPAAVICEIMKDDGEMARMPDLIQISKKYSIPVVSIKDIIEYRRQNERLIERIATIKLPTDYGDFTAFLYQSKVDNDVHFILAKGRIGVEKVINDPILVRMHSECVTGDVFKSKRCDCGEQMNQAMLMIQETGEGVFHYIKNHEGRGIGFINKIKAYALQEQGLDTVEANLKLGFPVDLRQYGIGAQILYDLGIRKIKLLTNNPKKIYGLEGFGLKVVEQVSLQVSPNRFNKKYLTTKQKKLGHLLQIK